ncbi:peptidylprolyl isomerase [Sphingomonas sp.]|jgi:peptidylprolyl isomerase|uniref:peptidylprolyl isomerase n=1 Tax=Sphingomonas sp. TaxID=28214 RepID=UPI002E36FA0D|nr:peptidylprolyl isomerase [Sphingomonas sp.]HEX4695632.1 peptidylprolyl isomerase [Sphingomonas sp.]
MPILLPLAAALFAQAATPAQPAPKPPLSPSDIVAAAPASAWRTIPDDDILIFTLANGRRVIVQLAPAFAPRHVERMRVLVNARWWDSTSVYRVQDNYVAQWGDVTEKKKLPAGVADDGPAEYIRTAGVPSVRLTRPDSFASIAGFDASGWPIASDGKSSWLTHCYGMVGVGRDLAPSVGSSAELYAVIGHAPRALDRNIALVGRVIEGIDALSSLERGTGKLGFYGDAQKPTPIVSARLASALPAGDRPHFEYLAPTSPAFARYLHARENREPPFFTVPAGGADICNVPVPVRPKK